MNKSKVILLGMIAVLSCRQVQALDTLRVAEHAFTAQQAVDYAMKNNVQVKNALLGIKLQQETNR
ncbi:MAG: TolC family protein, partial [Bacteroidetes bacterium]|nr:TolC family protein [Bacteroidota bacterium]